MWITGVRVRVPYQFLSEPEPRGHRTAQPYLNLCVSTRQLFWAIQASECLNWLLKVGLLSILSDQSGAQGTWEAVVQKEQHALFSPH